MPETILYYFSLIFPHTSRRLAHLRLLLFYDDSGFDSQYMIFAMLPLCIYYVHGFAAALQARDNDGNDVRDLRIGAFRVIGDCLAHWTFVYRLFDLVAALDVVLRESGFCGKVLVAIDLFMECTLIHVAKMILSWSVSLFVGTAIGGFPYLKGFFFSIWEVIQLHLQEFREQFHGWNEVFADDQFGEEQVLERDEVF